MQLAFNLPRPSHPAAIESIVTTFPDSSTITQLDEFHDVPSIVSRQRSRSDNSCRGPLTTEPT
ncbi:hypothetical protein BN1723_007774 [Verticillium longisporum]|uniref:Uncharacterized protein n=1 Tax=Verticillium longisporum TaxID=100787 RepID=A0A0G4NND3_VERLO|nr:hypothetical protein BN1723_007774 [Verticillium longisporum]